MAVDLAAMRKKFDAMKNLNEERGFSMFRPKYGKSKNDVAEARLKLWSWPPNGGELAKKLFLHFKLGTEHKDRAVCPKTYGMNNPCPVCEFIEAAEASGEPALLKRALDVKRQERYYMFVTDWDAYEKEGKKHVLVYDAAGNTFRKVMRMMLGDWGDFTLPSSNLLTLITYEQGANLPKAVDLQGSPKTVQLNLAEWLPCFPKWDNICQPETVHKLTTMLYGETETSEPTPAPAAAEASVAAAEDNIPMGDDNTSYTQQAPPAVVVAPTPAPVAPPVQRPTPVQAPAQMPVQAPAPAAQAAPVRRSGALNDLIAKANGGRK